MCIYIYSGDIVTSKHAKTYFVDASSMVLFPKIYDRFMYSYIMCLHQLKTGSHTESTNVGFCL